MKNGLLSILCIFSSLITSAQVSNSLTIDLSDPGKIQPVNVAVNKPLTVVVINCKSGLHDNLTLEVKNGSAQLPSVKLDCKKGTSIPMDKIFEKKDTASLHLTLNTDLRVKNDRKVHIELTITPQGALTPALQDVQQPVVATPGKGGDTAGLSKLPEFPKDFVKPEFLAPVLSSTAEANCRYPRIEFDPCCNRYEVYDTNGHEVDFLRYHSLISKNHGVVFLIKDFNTLKYDVTVGNTFSNNFTDIPDIFDQVYALLISGGGGVGVAADNNTSDADFQNELSKIVRLNKQLKEFVQKKMISADCGEMASFASQRAAIVTEIRSVFGSLLIDAKYVTAKNDIIQRNQAADPKYDNDKLNSDKQTLYHLPVTPDSVVQETKNLIDLLVTTKFEYQYNVPQLQNADSIVFTVNILPKSGLNGPIHVINQPISIPIRGGIKVDFSTGIYYSSIRNEKYALQPVIQADTVAGRTIVTEDGNNNGKSTLGVTGLMHIQVRTGSIRPSLVLGVGAALDLNYSLLVGAGVSLGGDNRFAMTAGLNYSSVKVLSSKYRDNTGAFIQQQKDVTSLDTYNKIKTGWFVGVTYSLSGAKKKQQASSTGVADNTDGTKGDDSGDSTTTTDKQDNTGGSNGTDGTGGGTGKKKK